MAKAPKEKSDLETHPDAWARFERAAGVVVKSPPQHRKTVKAKGKANEGSRGLKRRPKQD
jgi:hypothetical protein